MGPFWKSVNKVQVFSVEMLAARDEPDFERFEIYHIVDLGLMYGSICRPSYRSTGRVAIFYHQQKGLYA